MLLKCCTQYASKFGKFSSGHRTRKGQFSLQSQRKAMPKNVQTTAQLHSPHTRAEYCWKFSKPGFNSTWTVNFQMFKLGLEKAEELEVQLPTSDGSSKRQESSRKTSTSDLLTTPKPLCRSQQTMENSSRDGNTKPPDLPPEIWNLYAGQEATFRTGHGTKDWFQIGKEYIEAVYHHPAYLTSIQNISGEMPAWMKHSWNQDCWGKYQ